jgi:hypothetical protein
VSLTHQTGYAFITNKDILITEIRLNARATVRFGRCAMKKFDAIAKDDVRLMVFRRFAF